MLLREYAIATPLNASLNLSTIRVTECWHRSHVKVPFNPFLFVSYRTTSSLLIFSTWSFNTLEHYKSFLSTVSICFLPDSRNTCQLHSWIIGWMLLSTVIGHHSLQIKKYTACFHNIASKTLEHLQVSGVYRSFLGWPVFEISTELKTQHLGIFFTSKQDVLRNIQNLTNTSFQHLGLSPLYSLRKTYLGSLGRECCMWKQPWSTRLYSKLLWSLIIIPYKSDPVLKI